VQVRCRLNASIGTAAHDRVVLIRRELEELGNWPNRKEEQCWFQRQNELSKALAKYIFRPRAAYYLLSRTKQFGMVAADNTGLFKVQIRGRAGRGSRFSAYLSEAEAVLALVRLANRESSVGNPLAHGWPSGNSAKKSVNVWNRKVRFGLTPRSSTRSNRLWSVNVF
jgi:hypothetical protein